MKKLIFFTILLSAMLSACGNGSTVESSNDSLMTDSTVADSLPVDNLRTDTAGNLNP